jgi:halimadienyl-diphosphate synthase
VTSTFSLEFLGDQADLGRLNNDLQEGNGSIASSPSASSYFVRLTRDERAMNFLSRVVAKARGAVPTIVPIDVFERVWTLYALYLVDESLPEDVGDSLDALQTSWSPQGLTMGRYYPIPDLDNTALAFFLLGLVGKCPSPDVFHHYAREDHFATYPYERDPSASVHCHLLEALKVYPESAERARMRQQAVDFLAKTQVYETFWFDKWHASPYYTTSHAIIALLDLNTELVQNAITWIIQTQRPDGCWGYRGSTTEETAYALQALAYCARHGLDIPRQALDKAAEWLRNSTERKNAHYRSLFIGKTLFSPTWIVHSVVLSALAMYERL